MSSFFSFLSCQSTFLSIRGRLIEVAAALFDPGVVPIRESLDELVGAGRAKVILDDLRGERLAVYLPARVPVSVARIHGQLMGDRPPSEFYFCESTEAITILVASGYGISVLPDFLVPDMPMLSKVPLAGAEPVSFGIYYRSLQGNPALKALIQCVKECFS